LSDEKICHWCGKEIVSDVLIAPVPPSNKMLFAHRRCCLHNDVDGIPYCDCDQYIFPAEFLDGKYIFCALNGINAETDCERLSKHCIKSLVL